MVRALLAAAICVLAARGARAEITASLAAAAEQDDRTLPYRRAMLTIDASHADDDQVVRAVALRQAQGGPTFVYTVTVAPKTSQSLPVDLPATSQQQKYNVELLAEAEYPATVLARVTAPIHWPPEHVTALEFFKPQLHEKWADLPPAWSAGVRRNVFVALVLTCLAGAGAAMLGRRWLRVGALVVIAAAATGSLSALLDGEDIIVQDEVAAESAVVLRARRSAVWRHEGTDLVPLYFAPWHMAEDDTVIHVGRGIRVRMQARHETRWLKIFLHRKAPAPAGR